MALTKIDDRGLTTPIDLLDNEKIRFGTGNDLEVFHDGSDTYISNTSATDLVIRNTGNAGILIQNQNSYPIELKTNAEDAIKCNANGSVDLYYNGSKKLETITSGVRVSSGDLELLDNTGSTGRLLLGNGADLQLYHDGSNSYIKDAGTGLLAILSSALNITNAAGTEDGIKFVENGSVDIYYDNVKKLETTSAGVLVTNGTSPATLKVQGGEGNTAILQLTADDGDDWNDHTRFTGSQGEAYIELFNGTTYEKAAHFLHGDAVYLYFNGTKQAETTAAGLTINNYQLKVQAPAGSAAQLYLYGDNGSDNNDLWYMSAGNGVFNLNYYVGSGTWEKSIECNADGGVELYFNNDKVIEAGPNADNARIHGWLEAFESMGDAGYIYDGTNYPFHKLQSSVNSWAVVVDNSHDSEPYGVFVKFTDVSPDDNTSMYYAGVDGTGYKFKVFADGDVWTSDAGTLTSDETLKENITDATSKLEDLKKLKVRNFNWKSSFHPEKSKKKQIGFIAQEVEEVFPALVTETDISPDGAEKDHTPIMKKAIKAAWDPIIIKAMQELITKVETLETEVASLKAK